MIQAHFVIMIHGLLLFYCGFKMKKKIPRQREVKREKERERDIILKDENLLFNLLLL